MGRSVKKQQNILIFTGILVAVNLLVFTYSNFFGIDKDIYPTKSPSEITSATREQNESGVYDNKSTPTQASSVETSSNAPATQNLQTAVNLDTSTFQTATGESYPLRIYKPSTINDPGGNQWWTSSTGLDTVWTIGSGPRQTTVAVIDTGFALNHEEFTNRWAHNSGEQGTTTNETPSKLNCTDRGLPISQSCNLIDDDFDGIVDNEIGPSAVENPSRLNCTDAGLPLDKSCNGIDDDGNGYIDDVTGWDFVNFDASVQAGETNPNGSGVQHGTAVTGVLAANGNNNKGIAGVDWKTKILPLQALDDDSYGNTLTVSRAIYYAADRGVDVINLSLGSEADDPYLRQAIHYALSKNIIIVAASGNDGCDCISYPARYPEVIAVGAQDKNGNPAIFSNYGAELDILAPGDNITTSSWSKTLPSNGYVTNIAGTSLATPYVSGLLSLARSHQPTAQWSELFNSLFSSANHGTLTSTNPFSTQIGSGYAQADTFINKLTTPSQPGIRYTFGPTLTNSTLGSSLLYQCMGNDFPTAPLYEITSGVSTFYSIDELERATAAVQGNTVKYIAHICVGLPTDAPSTIRHINLLSEIKNMHNSKMW
jgi:hypothetical protein